LYEAEFKQGLRYQVEQHFIILTIFSPPQFEFGTISPLIINLVLWPKEGQTTQWPKEGQTTQWPKEGQTTQWPKEDGQKDQKKPIHKTTHRKLKIE
jgi:hypothetical protein